MLAFYLVSPKVENDRRAPNTIAPNSSSSDFVRFMPKI